MPVLPESFYQFNLLLTQWATVILLSLLLMYFGDENRRVFFQVRLLFFGYVFFVAGVGGLVLLLIIGFIGKSPP